MPVHKNLVGLIHDVSQKIHDETKGASAIAKQFAAEKMLNIRYVDLVIQFIGASGLPKMDMVGTADPYFVAKLDKKLSFVSTVKFNTQVPAWNEIWKVNNVPDTATLSLEVLDKDNGKITDDFIGSCETTVSPGAKELTIELRPFNRDRGKLWLKIDSVPSQDPHAKDHPLIFDGPIRFSRHSSPTVGLLTNLDQARLYYTWKMFIKGVPLFLGDSVQEWNHDYKAAQTIFAPGAASLAVRSSIQAGHRMLYARTANSAFGVIEGPADFFRLLHGDGSGAGTSPYAHRVKPAVYTYVIAIEDDSLRFSETGAAFFVDYASKHALHANCAPAVRYSGEFHPRPEGGWAAFNDATPDEAVRWEFVVDNNSGTYAPDEKVLPQLQALLEHNFPWLTIVALDRKDPRLEESREACRAYALAHRGVKQDELQPHAHAGEQPLAHSVSTKMHSIDARRQDFPE